MQTGKEGKRGKERYKESKGEKKIVEKISAWSHPTKTKSCIIIDLSQEISFFLPLCFLLPLFFFFSLLPLPFFSLKQTLRREMRVFVSKQKTADNQCNYSVFVWVCVCVPKQHTRRISSTQLESFGRLTWRKQRRKTETDFSAIHRSITLHVKQKLSQRKVKQTHSHHSHDSSKPHSPSGRRFSYDKAAVRNDFVMVAHSPLKIFGSFRNNGTEGDKTAFSFLPGNHWFCQLKCNLSLSDFTGCS